MPYVPQMIKEERCGYLLIKAPSLTAGIFLCSCVVMRWGGIDPLFMPRILFKFKKNQFSYFFGFSSFLLVLLAGSYLLKVN